MKQRFYNFMQGRYGNDNFSRFLLLLTCVFLLVSSFTRLTILYWIGLALLFYCWFRMFSRNIAKRAAENRKYLELSARFRNYFANLRYRHSQKKIYRIYKCPNCRQKFRIPKGHGKVEVRCPKCGTTFIKKS